MSAVRGADRRATSSSSRPLLSSLELSDTKIYEPSIRALLGTAPHFCRVVVLKWMIALRGADGRASARQATIFLTVYMKMDY